MREDHRRDNGARPYGGGRNQWDASAESQTAYAARRDGTSPGGWPGSAVGELEELSRYIEFKISNPTYAGAIPEDENPEAFAAQFGVDEIPQLCPANLSAWEAYDILRTIAPLGAAGERIGDQLIDLDLDEDELAALLAKWRIIRQYEESEQANMRIAPAMMMGMGLPQPGAMYQQQWRGPSSSQHAVAVPQEGRGRFNRAEFSKSIKRPRTKASMTPWAGPKKEKPE